MKVKIQIINNVAKLPNYSHEGDSGMDLYSCMDCTILPGERKLIPTGLKIQLPHNTEAQIRPRSGLALKYGITVLNTPGTIDAGYRGEIGVILINLGDNEFDIHVGDRIAQIVFQSIKRASFEIVSDLDATNRGEGGYGSTGV